VSISSIILRRLFRLLLETALRVGFPIQGIDRIAVSNEKILARYACSMKARDISLQLEEFYGAQVSLTLFSEVTDSVTEEVKAW
jgi:hypothetical protein